MRPIDVAVYALGIAAVLAVPGPTNAVAFHSGMVRGRAALLVTLPAVAAGYLVVLVAATGAAQWLLRNPEAIVALRWICALYLGLVAFGLWRAAKTPLTEPGKRAPGSDFRMIFTVTLLNPKGWVIAFLAAADSYDRGGADLRSAATLIAIFIPICLATTASYSLAGTALNVRRRNPAHRLFLLRCSAAVIGALALAMVVAG